MSVKISRSVLEAALRQMLNEEDAPQGPTPPADPPAQADAANSQAPKETSDTDRFNAQVDKLNKMKGPISIGSDKFEKKSGSWYIASVGGQQGFDKEGLLSLVKDDAQEDVAKKIEKDQAQQGRLGVTIRGEQFIDQGAFKGATFKIGESGLYTDASPIPVEILAQYYFDEELGEDMSGAVKANVSGTTGERALVYRSDELIFIIDRGEGNFYVMSEGNNESNALQATADLIAKLDQSKRIGSTGATYKGFSRKTKTDQDITTLENYRKYLVPDQSGTPFDVRIANFKFIGDLQKAIAGRRTLISKFVDLFGRDELEMSFTFTKWGPAFMRARVFGSRGISGGGGAVTDTDMDALAATGLFREENLSPAGVSEYIPDKGKNQGYIDYVDTGMSIPVVVTPVRGPSGVRVEGVSSLGNALTVEPEDTSPENKDKYTNTYADAYFLFSVGALSPKAAPEPAAQTAEPVAPPKQDKPKLEDWLRQREGQPIGDPGGAVYFNFKASNVNDVSSNAVYFQSIVEALSEMASAVAEIPAGFTVQLSLIGCADPAGTNPFNEGLGGTRNQATYDELKNNRFNKVNYQKFNPPKLIVNGFKPGENPWPPAWNSIKDSAPGAEKLRFTKLYWGKFATPEAAGAKALEFATKQLQDAGLAPSVKKETVSRELDQIREQVRKAIRDI